MKNNLFGQILIAGLALFLLIGSLQMFGIGQGINEIKVDEENQPSIPTIPKAMNAEVKDTQNNSKQLVGNIKLRPLFSTDRVPFVAPIEDLTKDGLDEKMDIPELKAQLTGVMITPEGSYAMILDNLTNKRDTYKVGMPLDGEQGGWTIDSIQSRKVVFVSDDNKSEELELAIYSGSTNKAKGAAKKAKGKDGKNKPLSRADKKKNADDIRKKIAERRAQMRAEAAKKKNR